MESLEFYPQELWEHSPVYNIFVKLFAKDIHALQANPEGAESTRFWLNHPIRWVQVVGIIVALTEKDKFDVVLLDDSSGQTIELVIAQEEHRKMMPDRDDEEQQERLWKRRRKPGTIDVGSLIKVKGEIREHWGVQKVHVMKLDIVTDQNIETKAWEERVAFKRSTLSKPWKLPAAKISKHHSKPTKENVTTPEPEKSKPNKPIIDFNSLPPYAHSIRNLKLLVLSHINTLQRFSAAELLSLDHIHNAATCVARRDIAKQITERDVTNMLLAALNLLLRDGNIIVPRFHQQINEYIKQDAPPATADETFVVVGTWNLGSTVKSVAKRDGKVEVRDLWRKVMSWGSGWEATTKGVIGVVVEEVLTRIEGQEWVESKPGVWTKLDV